jgi:hypothetical protein
VFEAQAVRMLALLVEIRDGIEAVCQDQMGPGDSEARVNDAIKDLTAVSQKKL